MKFAGLALTAALFLSGALSGLVIARDYGDIYTREEMQKAHADYSENIKAVLFEDLAAYLTPEELASLRRVKLLQPWERKLDPFEFAANPQTGEILVPTFSVKFLDDLSVALAWYEKNACDRSTIMDYVTALDYSELQLSPPLITLNIPENIYEQDAYVKDVAQKILKDAVAFLLLHELGHVHHRHQSYQTINAAQAQQQESQADEFALNVYRRMRSPPLGVSVWFMLVAYRDPLVPHSPAQTHPLTSARLEMIASQLKNNPGAFISVENRALFSKARIQSVANELDVIASILKSPQLREFLQYRGENITLELLQQGCSADRENKLLELFKRLLR